MRTILAARCARRIPRPEPVTTWARRVVRDPARHHATEVEAAMVASLLADVDTVR